MMAGLTASTKAVAEHESKRSFEHCFISMLKAGFLVESENFPGRREFLVGTREEAINLAPSQSCAFLVFSCCPTSRTRLLRQTFSRNASFRARREFNSFRVRTV